MTSLLINDIDDALFERLRQSAEAHCRTVEREVIELLRGEMANQEQSRPSGDAVDARRSSDADNGGAVVAPRPSSVPSPENLSDAVRRLFGPEHGVELDIPARGTRPRRPAPDFSDH